MSKQVTRDRLIPEKEGGHTKITYARPSDAKQDAADERLILRHTKQAKK